MNLEQTRATTAYEHIQGILAQPEADRSRYGTLALKLPILVRSAGLCQALHFVQSRAKSDPSKPEMRILDHIADQLARVDPTIKDANSLCMCVRGADMKTYLHLTREATMILQWYARLTRSLLGIEPTDDMEEDR